MILFIFIQIRCEFQILRPQHEICSIRSEVFINLFLECNCSEQVHGIFVCIIIPMSHILCFSKLNGIYRIVFPIGYFSGIQIPTL